VIGHAQPETRLTADVADVADVAEKGLGSTDFTDSHGLKELKLSLAGNHETF
jgi:hypothetical protein